MARPLPISVVIIRSICHIIFIAFVILLSFIMPPLAILLLGSHCRQQNNFTFSLFSDEYIVESREPIPLSRETLPMRFYKVGTKKAFMLSCILTLLGFFPGVIFSLYVVTYYVVYSEEDVPYNPAHKTPFLRALFS